MLSGKKILIGITGGIAAYKIPTLIRLLKKAGAEVQVIMSDMAKEFITPLTISTLSGNTVLSTFHDPKTGHWNSHVDLGMWADVYLIAPVTATTMGKMANGIADNLLVTTYLSAKCPVVFAPAMDLDMYLHPTTIANVEKLQEFGNLLIKPNHGELASGLCGEGRMEEPENIFNFLAEVLKKKADLKGKTVLLTAGPTYEAIDPVRFIGNYSSGIMGYSLANECAQRGANVILISGPTNQEIKHPSVKLIKIKTADEMFDQCHKYFAKANIAILSAAVADYKPAKTKPNKIKKKEQSLNIELVATKDILASLGELKSPQQILVGFALETNNEIENAKKKLKNKRLDFIVLNSLNDKGAGFGTSTNKITIIKTDEEIQFFDLKPKQLVAQDIVNNIVDLLQQK